MTRKQFLKEKAPTFSDEPKLPRSKVCNIKEPRPTAFGPKHNVKHYQHRRDRRVGRQRIRASRDDLVEFPVSSKPVHGKLRAKVAA